MALRCCLAAVGVLAWRTMEPGKFQELMWVLLGVFRVAGLLGWRRSGRMVRPERAGWMSAGVAVKADVAQW